MMLYLVTTTGGEARSTSVVQIAEVMKNYFVTWPPAKAANMSIDVMGNAIQEHMKIHMVTAGGENNSNHSLKTLAESVPRIPLRILVSYYYFKDVKLDHLLAHLFPEQPVDVFLDSGAYSAMTQSTPISIDDYAKYILQYQGVVTTYANLDVVHDAKATLHNQDVLERGYGLKPLPVFHVREDWSHLDRYLERYQYIALGGIARVRPSQYMPWLVQCFKRAKGKAVFHGFGITNWETMKSFPWYSVDSTSWGRGFRFGTMPLFDKRTGRTVNIQLGDHASCYKYAHVFRDLGFDPTEFAEKKVPDRRKVCALGVISFMQAEVWLQHFWGTISIPKVYLAEVQDDMADIYSVAPYLKKGEV